MSVAHDVRDSVGASALTRDIAAPTGVSTPRNGKWVTPSSEHRDQSDAGRMGRTSGDSIFNVSATRLPAASSVLLCRVTIPSLATSTSDIAGTSPSFVLRIADFEQSAPIFLDYVTKQCGIRYPTSHNSLSWHPGGWALLVANVHPTTADDVGDYLLGGPGIPLRRYRHVHRVIQARRALITAQERSQHSTPSSSSSPQKSASPGRQGTHLASSSAASASSFGGGGVMGALRRNFQDRLHEGGPENQFRSQTSTPPVNAFLFSAEGAASASSAVGSSLSQINSKMFDLEFFLLPAEGVDPDAHGRREVDATLVV